MDFKIPADSEKSIPPLPRTSRGYGIHIDGTTVGEKKLLYCNRNHVYIRSLEDQFKSWVFCGHKTNVEVAKFSPNGQWVASGDDKGNVLVWGAKNFNLKNNVKVNMGILDVSWGADNSQIAAVGKGGNGVYARVFRIDSSNSIGEIVHHTGTILSCALRPTRPLTLLTASEDFTVNVYANIPYKYVKKHRIYKKYPNCVRFNNEGNLAACVGGDSKINIFTGEGDLSNTIENTKGGHTGSIYSCCFSPDGNKLLTAGADKTARIWDLETLKCEKTYKVGNSVCDMQVSCLWLEGYVMSVSLDGSINFLDLENEGNLLKVWKGHQSKAEALLVDEENKLIFTSCQNGRIVKWDIENKESSEFGGKGHGVYLVNHLSFNFDKTKIYSSGYDNYLRISDVSNLKTEEIQKVDSQPVALVTGNVKENLIVLATTKNSAYYSGTGDKLKKLELNYQPVSMALSSDDSILVIGTKDKIILCKPENDGFTETESISRHSGPVTHLEFSRNMEFFLSIGEDRKVFVWDVSKGYESPINTRGWKLHHAKVMGACFDQSAERVATGSKDESIIVWKTVLKGNSAKREVVKFAHLTGVNLLKCFDSEHYVSAGEDKMICFRKF